MPEKLHELARCLNESSHLNHGGFDSAQPPTSDTDCDDVFDADYDFDADWAEPKSGAEVRSQRAKKRALRLFS